MSDRFTVSEHQLTVMIGTHLQCFISPHDDTDAACVSVFEQFDLARSTLLPFAGRFRRVKPEEFSASVNNSMDNQVIPTCCCSHLTIVKAVQCI